MATYSFGNAIIFDSTGTVVSVSTRVAISDNAGDTTYTGAGTTSPLADSDTNQTTTVSASAGGVYNGVFTTEGTSGTISYFDGLNLIFGSYGHIDVGGTVYRFFIPQTLGANFVLGNNYTGSGATTAGFTYGNVAGSGIDLITLDTATNFNAGAGNDVVLGSSGNDTIIGGNGEDQLTGGGGNDSITGGSGIDKIRGGAGNDTIDGGSESDRLFGGAGNDSLIGGTSSDLLYGGDDNDTLIGGGSADVLFGGSGVDNIDGGDGTDRIYAGTGDDILVAGGASADLVTGGSGNDLLIGDIRLSEFTAGNDVIDGQAGNDSISGQAGNDSIYGGAGNDLIEGDDGNDVIFGDSSADIRLAFRWRDLVDPSGDGSAIDLNDNLNAGASLDTGGVTVSVSYTQQASSTLTFSDNPQNIGLIDRTDGVGTIPISEFSGAVMQGPTKAPVGDPAYDPNSGITRIDFASSDTSYTSEVNNISFNINDVDQFTAGAASGNWTDVVKVTAIDALGNPVTVNLSVTSTDIALSDTNGDTIDDTATGNASLREPTQTQASLQVNIPGPVQSVFIEFDNGAQATQQIFISDITYDPISVEADGNDTIDAGAGTDSVVGGGGNDVITGGTGVDTLQGDAGDDTFVMTNDFDADIISGGADNDTITGINLTKHGMIITAANDTDGSIGDTSTTGSYTGIESFVLSGEDDVVDVSASSTGLTLDGLGGNDTIIGTSGADNITGSTGNDSLTGGAGNDTLIGDTNSGFTEERLGLKWSELKTPDPLDSKIDGVDDLTVQNGDDLSAGVSTVQSGMLVSVSFKDDDPTANDPETFTYDGTTSQRENDIVGIGGVDADDQSALKIAGDGSGTGTAPISTTTIDFRAIDTAFNDNVKDISFRINGIDSQDNVGDTRNDVVRVFAYDADGNAVPVTFATSGTDTVVTDSDAVNGDDTVANESGTPRSATSSRGSALVSIDGPVARIEIVYLNSAGDGQEIFVSEVYFSTLPAAGNDTISGGDDDDSISGGVGTDVLLGDAGNDTIEGGDDADTITGGTGNDSMTGGEASDTFVMTNLFGTDTIIGSEDVGDPDVDVIDASGLTAHGVNIVMTGEESGTISDFTNSAGTFIEIENIIFSDQADSYDGSALSSTQTIETGDGNDTIIGGSGNDTLTGGNGDDTITGGTGNDSLVGGTGDDTFQIIDNFATDVIIGGADTDVIDASNLVTHGVNIVLTTDSSGAIDDTTNPAGSFTGIEEFILSNQADTFDGSNATSGFNIAGGGGNDTLRSGAGADTMNGGDGRDLVFAGIGDVATGGEGPIANGVEDFDTLALDRVGPNEFRVITYDPGSTPSNLIGTVTYYDGPPGDPGSSVTGTMSFSEFESVVCFTKGTRIRTERGDIDVDKLHIGDMVVTLDNGLQPIRWIGHRAVPSRGRFAPIRFATGVCGNTRPLMVSPQHRMLRSDPMAELMFGESEVLVAAKDMVNGVDVTRNETSGLVDYYHILFDQHEIVFAENAPSESLNPGQHAMNGAVGCTESVKEILALFPELQTNDGTHSVSARSSLRARETKLLSQLAS